MISTQHNLLVGEERKKDGGNQTEFLTSLHNAMYQKAAL